MEVCTTAERTQMGGEAEEERWTVWGQSQCVREINVQWGDCGTEKGRVANGGMKISKS